MKSPPPAAPLPAAPPDGPRPPDDASLELVRGVGPATLTKLRAAGIRTGAQLAALEGPQIARIASMHSGLGVKRLEGCVRAAREGRTES